MRQENLFQELQVPSILFNDGDWVESKDQDKNGSVRLIQLADIGDGRFINKSKRFMNIETAKRLNCTFLRKNDILIARMPDPLGRCCLFPFDEDEKYVTVVDIAILRVAPDYSQSYIQYIINTTQARHAIEGQITGTTRKRITRKKLEKLKIPLPPLPEQQKIAAILDAADKLRQKDQQLIEQYNALSQSLFLDMFGDPVINPMGWDSIKLEEISDIASGVTKGRKLKSEANLNIPYMRVANVQDGYLNLSEIKTIPGTEGDIEKFSLIKGDVLLTEGGDPDKLGRGAVWNNEIDNCIHQNHIFRVRITCNESTPIYLSKLCGSEYGKRYFLKSGKQTTGIASINKTQLKRFPVLRPPITLQNQFAERIQAIEAQKQQAQASLKKSDDLFNSLLQRAFKGELTT